MTEHLRYADLDEQIQREALEGIIRNDPLLMDVLRRLRELALPDPWLVAGAIYNTAWNHLAGRPPLTGIRDVDVIYFDDRDLSWDAEDEVVQRAATAFSGLPVPVEVRNQARVHLWFPEKFGAPYPRLTRSTDAMLNYASRTHAVGARLEPDDGLTIAAPFGLADLFAFRIAPNHALDNRLTHERKAERAKSIWPEITVIPW